MEKDNRSTRELLKDRDYIGKLLASRPQWQIDLKKRYQDAWLKTHQKPEPIKEKLRLVVSN